MYLRMLAQQCPAKIRLMHPQAFRATSSREVKICTSQVPCVTIFNKSAIGVSIGSSILIEGKK